MTLPANPLAKLSLREFATVLRRGETSAEAVTLAYLERIRALDAKLGTFRVVTADAALKAARGIDSLLAAGTDLGPLMGVPVAVKEIFATGLLPAGAGSDMDIRFLGLSEGPFIRALKRAGCIVLGITKTTEFAAATINVDKPMPWNPADPTIKRVCGGSSHGSAAAMRAGLCAFSVGSDTGGSVRLPAALCGVFGYKSTAGRWSTAGVFPLSPSMDSVGVFTRTADDAAVIFDALESATSDQQASNPGLTACALRIGRPRQYFTEVCDPVVLSRFDKALAMLRLAGCHIADVDLPDVSSAMSSFGPLLFGEFAALVGRERFEANRKCIDRVPAARIEGAVGMTAEALVGYRARHRAAVATGLVPPGIDALVTPAAPFQPCPVDDVASFESAAAWNIRAGHCTRPGNFYGLCGTTIPIQVDGELPIGLQVLAPAGHDSQLLAISQTIEAVVGSHAA
ncbi:MAG TPA: amidase [Pseudolabrys sp.]|nr:amidase [Pseudolabrys sp.]